MKIELIVPETFRKHYERDKFEDSLERVAIDLQCGSVKMSGKYEWETIDMLVDAFKKSREVASYACNSTNGATNEGSHEVKDYEQK